LPYKRYLIVFIIEYFYLIIRTFKKVSFILAQNER